MEENAYMKLASGGQDRLGSYRIMKRLMACPRHLKATKALRGRLVRESCRSGNTPLLHLLINGLSVTTADLTMLEGEPRRKFFTVETS